MTEEVRFSVGYHKDDSGMPEWQVFTGYLIDGAWAVFNNTAMPTKRIAEICAKRANAGHFRRDGLGFCDILPKHIKQAKAEAIGLRLIGGAQ